jgi:two-component system sensor histidine kinase DctS
VPFVGLVKQGEVRIRWTPGLRQLFRVDNLQKGWRGGPFFNEQVLAEDRARVRQAVARLLNNGENLDVTYCLNAGTTTHCVQVCARLESQGGVTRVVGVFKDCSSDTAVERRRQASQERLQSVGRLTLLGEVASGLAHELNQPLAAIATFAQAGERLLGLPEPRVAKAQEVFREVSQQALRAGEIIRHMRSLIKRRAAQFESVTCETLMAEFLALAEPIARAGQVQLVTSIDAPARRVCVDQAQIHQALMILFQNALEATREHHPDTSQVGPQVRVALRPRETGVELAIEDQGPGISDAVAAQLFQPFFSTKETGTGLGLISCRNMLEAHHCRLSFINLPGGGCRFWFELPYEASPQRYS